MFDIIRLILLIGFTLTELILNYCFRIKHLSQSAGDVEAVGSAVAEGAGDATPGACVGHAFSHTEDVAAFANHYAVLIAAAWTCGHTAQSSRVDLSLLLR